MTTTKVARLQDANVHSKPIENTYSNVVRMLGRVHHRLLDVVNDELERHNRQNITAVQALLLYNIGDETLGAGEVMRRGYYMGTNASYNLKKLVDCSFIEHQRSQIDRRSVQIKLTASGLAIRDVVKKLFERHASVIEVAGGISMEDLSKLNQVNQHLERFWTDWILYRM